MFRTVLVALLATVMPSAALAQSLDAGLGAVRARLSSAQGYAGVFGVASAEDAKVDRLGEARPGLAHDVDRPVRWASVSKMITAILVFRQVDAGRLDLDAPVSTYLASTAAPNADRITIRQLLAHRSGMSQQADLPAGRPAAPLEYCKSSSAEPGSAFAYNNCDTIVLGEVLEAVTGLGFLALANAEIAAPLGFTLDLPDEARVDATVADGSDESAVWPSGYGPAGGLYGRVADLLAIDVALMSGRLISQDSLDIMLTGDPAAGYAALSVWSYEPDLGGCLGKTRLVERYGEIGGVQVRNFLLPDRGLALAVYSNDGRTAFGEVWRGTGLSIDLIRAAACG